MSYAVLLRENDDPNIYKNTSYTPKMDLNPTRFKKYYTGGPLKFKKQK